jgi:cyclopropane fatty-acyl-phospholipid synthase-like methyltransferase
MTINENSLNFWKGKALNRPTEKTAKVNAFNDYTQLDAAFILKYATKNSVLLDLASGTGLILNKIYDKVRAIVAVERFEEFSRFIQKSDNITVINEDIKKYAPASVFDLVTMFGVVQYFDYSEIAEIYQKYSECLKPQGKLIIKNQFGVKEDVLISGYSEELKEDYFSQYRYIGHEVELLTKTGYRNIEVVDIYPPECNRWDNTHFYAIVAEK